MRQALKTARENAGATQKETATAVGISERMYRKIEAGKCRPNVETAISIAKNLDRSVEELFGYKTPQLQLREQTKEPL
jgi:DNA-binding XRE family transcriptional regulator